MPGMSQGNDLNVHNRRFERGGILSYLKDLPALMVFNDEAHHIHDFKREGEVTEVEWQKSLNLISQPKGARFVQVDFSATPRSEEHTSELQSLMRISYDVFWLKQKKQIHMTYADFCLQKKHKDSHTNSTTN